MLKEVIEKIRLKKIIRSYSKNKNIILNISYLPLSSDIQIDKNSIVNIKKISLNKNCSIRVRKNSSLTIGLETTFNNGCILTSRKNIVIGNKCSFGPNVMIFDHDHDINSNDYRVNYVSDDIIIGNNVWVGAGAIILKGSKICDNAVIAAGSIVKGFVPANSIYYNSIEKKIRKFK